MRKINHILNIFLAFAIVACGGNESSTISTILADGDMESIRAKKKELTTQLKKVEVDIALLDSAIEANSGDSNIPLITALEVKAQEFVHYVELQGDVTTRQNVLIYPEVAGVMIKTYVEEGDKVKKGQLLATIDDGGLSNQLIQMKTQLSLAETTYERQKRLWDQKIGSEIQYLQAKASYESQKAAVDQMESQLRKFSMRAPFDGIVDDVIKDQGTVVAPGGPGSEVFRVVNLSKMYIETLVPETYITSVTKGKKVKVFFPILNETIESFVRETGNYINPNNRSFAVQIPVPNKSGNVKPNLTARVHINDYRKDAALLIPQSAISENSEGEQYAYVVTNINKDNVAVAKKTIITTGKTQGDIIEVLSGISDGQSIIIEGARSVKDGQGVKILNY
ncbi:efflux RND transporter periplasmic adaptor subunit [Ekhidna sp.]|uniref:efflux RND transporter periplasmic adaptor subunit n=1 Tax=Ekhidna sp. TaxID=2608089 RepID=UPI00329913D8